MFLLLREPTEGILSMHMASAWCCLKARTLLHRSCVLPRSLDDHIARSEGLRVPCLSGPESIWAFYREVGGSHWVSSPHHSVPVWPPGPGAWSQGRYLGRSTLDMQAWRPLQVQKSCRREDKAGVSPHTLSTPSICRCSIGSGQVRGCPADLSPACCWLQYSHWQNWALATWLLSQRDELPVGTRIQAMWSRASAGNHSTIKLFNFKFACKIIFLHCKKWVDVKLYKLALKCWKYWALDVSNTRMSVKHQPSMAWTERAVGQCAPTLGHHVHLPTKDAETYHL